MMEIKKPWIVAHRGGRAYGPENTLRAIENGIQMGADAIEFDVRVTKDSIPVLFHDQTIKRTTNKKANIQVSELTLEELKELDIGSWYSASFSGEHILTLEEAFQQINHRKPLLVELKDIDIRDVIHVVDVIQTYYKKKRIFVLSFYGELLQRVKELESSIETVLLYHKDNRHFEDIVGDTSFDHIGLRRRLAMKKEAYIKHIHDHNKLCFVYTVNDRRSARVLLQRGVDVLITDNPIKMEQAVSKQKRP